MVVPGRFFLSQSGWKGGRSPPFISKNEAFLLVGISDEAFFLVVNWTMLCDWSELNVWTMHPDWSGLNPEFWLVRIDDWFPQVGRLKSEYHKLAGLRSCENHKLAALRFEYHKLAGLRFEYHKLASLGFCECQKLAGWGLSTLSWPVKHDYVTLR